MDAAGPRWLLNASCRERLRHCSTCGVCETDLAQVCKNLWLRPERLLRVAWTIIKVDVTFVLATFPSPEFNLPAFVLPHSPCYKRSVSATMLAVKGMKEVMQACMHHGRLL